MDVPLVEVVLAAGRGALVTESKAGMDAAVTAWGSGEMLPTRLIRNTHRSLSRVPPDAVRSTRYCTENSEEPSAGRRPAVYRTPVGT